VSKKEKEKDKIKKSETQFEQFCLMSVHIVKCYHTIAKWGLVQIYKDGIISENLLKYPVKSPHEEKKTVCLVLRTIYLVKFSI
jgi:hypothetical protein